MTRWKLINNDEYIKAAIDCIVTSGKPIKNTRRELSDFFIRLKKEFLHGEQPIGGCRDARCKSCYPNRDLIPKKQKHDHNTNNS